MTAGPSERAGFIEAPVTGMLPRGAAAVSGPAPRRRPRGVPAGRPSIPNEVVHQYDKADAEGRRVALDARPRPRERPRAGLWRPHHAVGVKGDARDGEDEGRREQRLEQNAVADRDQRAQRVGAVVDLGQRVGVVHALEHGGAGQAAGQLRHNVTARP